MRRRELQRRGRRNLAWYLVGFLVAQFVLALGVDRFWLSVRDPEFMMLRNRLVARQSEGRGRPLVLALGSSRTQMGLHAGSLSHTADTTVPLVFNFGLPGTGLMMQQVVLRRLLEQGVRPDLVFVEVMPMSMIRSGRGAPMEENLDGARLNLEEALQLLPYYHQPYRLLRHWLNGRLLPVNRHRAELGKALAMYSNRAQPGGAEEQHIGAYGFRGGGVPPSPEQVARETSQAIRRHEYLRKNVTPAEGPFCALRSLLTLCRQEHIAVALVIAPVGSAFRAEESGEKWSAIDDRIRAVAAEFGVPLYDARTWIPDDGFWDGHHLAGPGAERYTERFRRDVLLPEMRRRLSGKEKKKRSGGR